MSSSSAFDSNSASRIIDEGDLVYSHHWESGGPMAGEEQVFQLNDQFAVFSLDFGSSGPFSSLEEAIKKQELHRVNGATTVIQCPVRTVDSIKSLLTAAVDAVEFRLVAKDGDVRVDPSEL